jgi:2-iminoacetate synthase ThiH
LSVKPTTEGVVRLPDALMRTLGSSPSMTATHEFVVPRSMPMILDMERLTLDDGMTLYETPDLWGVFELADLVRDRLHPGVGYYNINRHLNYSNVCALSCKFCEFYRKKGDDGAYTRDMD